MWFPHCMPDTPAKKAAGEQICLPKWLTPCQILALLLTTTTPMESTSINTIICFRFVSKLKRHLVPPIKCLLLNNQNLSLELAIHFYTTMKNKKVENQGIKDSCLTWNRFQQGHNLSSLLNLLPASYLGSEVTKKRCTSCTNYFY